MAFIPAHLSAKVIMVVTDRVALRIVPLSHPTSWNLGSRSLPLRRQVGDKQGQ